ncbi:hypothetical protein DSM101010T_13540 [Desulfovibrio subterraneus]|uniref:Uncharacterized protein n=1 Tax=Desulfovibrio subterraneus TaxID=2718620 RepID=A0A7J0BGZ3_9BACT|nr:hypothetical protein DSM101010T_13540 [Desulfovibrio subterraneus]
MADGIVRSGAAVRISVRDFGPWGDWRGGRNGSVDRMPAMQGKGSMQCCKRQAQDGSCMLQVT